MSLRQGEAGDVPTTSHEDPHRIEIAAQASSLGQVTGFAGHGMAWRLAANDKHSSTAVGYGGRKDGARQNGRWQEPVFGVGFGSRTGTTSEDGRR